MKKRKIFCLLLLLVLTGCSFNKKADENNFKEEFTTSSESSWGFNVAKEVRPNSNNIIEKNPYLSEEGIVIIKNNSVEKTIIIVDDYDCTNNDEEYKYYTVSLGSSYLPIAGKINYNNQIYDYEIRIDYHIINLKNFFENANILDTDTSKNLFGGYSCQNLFDNVFKKVFTNNLNNFIINYLDSNNLEFNQNNVNSNGFRTNIEEKLNNLLNNSYGIDINDFSLTIK